MSFRLGIEGTSTRAISERSHEIMLTFEIVRSLANKIRRASLSIFDQKKGDYTNGVALPIAAERVQEYMENSIQEWGQFVSKKERLEAVEKWVRENFQYQRWITPEDLCRTDEESLYPVWMGYEDARMKTWVATAIESTCHAIELKKNTRFMTIPLLKQADCCYRYALERAGLEVPIIDTPSTLKRILLANFDVVEKPEEGDLILFSKVGQLTHLGMQYKENVLSKEGNAARVAYIRPIEDLVQDYGEKITYLRKKSAESTDSELVSGL